MLTYEDCVGLSGLTPEEIAAIAGHEHRPAIVALELGWCLRGSPAGRRALRRMILERLAAARAEGDGRTAAAARPAGLTDGELGDLPPALGLDTTTAPWVRARVDAYLTAMLRHFALDGADAQARVQAVLPAAARRCAACPETDRCRRFLAGVAGGDSPAAFCPNATLFRALQEPGGREAPLGGRA